MFVFASFTKEDRQKVRRFKQDLMLRLHVDKESEISDVKDPPENSSNNRESNSSSNDKGEKKAGLNTSSEEKIVGKNVSNYSHSTITHVFDAKEKAGTIGIFSDKEEDKISDNFFTIDIPKNSITDQAAYLEYDLYGLASYQSVPRSINNNVAVGGEIIVPKADWSHQREEISQNLLKDGNNLILFTAPISGVKYKVKNVKVVFENKNHPKEDLIVNSLLSENKLYIKGNTEYSGSLTVNNEVVPVHGGEFEKVVNLSDDDRKAGSFSVAIGGVKNTYKIPKPVNSFKMINSSYFSPKLLEISKEKEYDTDYEDIKIKVEKESSESASVEFLKLREKDFPTTSQGLKNVTLNNSAYRLSVVKGKLNKKLRISLPYDEKRLGQAPAKEIKAFYFDYKNKQWKIETSAVVDEKSKMVIIESDQDNDYINGIISVPESPGINSFTPTSISGLKAGNPVLGIQLFSPPTPNQKGDAAMSYPIHLPAGVNGMQPHLSVTYNSSKGNGWMGEGWDIAGISGITLDTRWGTPAFDPSYESEIYLLDGEMLMYEGDYLPHRHIDKAGLMDVARQPRNSSGKKNFYLRKNNNFTKIERYGSSPSSYTWVVTTTDGTKRFYGGSETTVNGNAVVQKGDGAIVQWGIVKELDVHNNNIKYYYFNQQFTQGIPPVSGDNINLEKGIQFHINQIYYSGVNDTDGPYKVNFIYKIPERPDYVIDTKEGIKRVEIERLDNILVSHNQLDIREYGFTYATGKFYKSILKTISGPGVKYELDYYNDVGNAVFGPDKLTTAPAPDAFSGPVNSALTPSRISADNNFEWGWTLRTGLGLGLFTPHTSGDKNFMVSGFVGGSYPDIKRGQELLDFNGDGVMDILYRKRNGDNGIKLIPGSLDGNGNLEFNGYEVDVLNLKSNFTKTKGSTFNTGASILFNWWKMGFDFTKSWSESESKTPVYIIDANSDGLPDVVKDDKVWFNKINPDGQPEMVTTSDMTENMVMKGNIPVPYEEPEDLDDDEGEEPVRAKNDVVKVWIAPKAGYIKIQDHISITNMQETAARAVYSIEAKNPDNPSKNGRLYLTTLVGGSPNIDLKIEKYNDYAGTPMGIGSASRIQVESGDRIYFRLHKKTGINYEVNTTPSVQYVTANGTEIPDTDQEELDGFSPNNLKYEESFLLNNLTKTLKFDYTTTGHIDIPGFSVPELHDDVTFKITLSKAEVVNPWDVTVLYSKTYSQSLGTVNIDPVDMDFYAPITPNGLYMKFIVESDSYMNKEIEWKNIKVSSAWGNSMDVASYPSYYVRDFKKKFHVADLGNAPQGATHYYISINKNFSFSPSLPGNFMYVIKKNGLVLGKRWVKIENTGITETSLNGITDPILFYTGDPYHSVLLEDKINIVVYCNTQKDRAAYEALKSQLQNNIFNIFVGTNTNLLASTVETALNTAEFNSISAVYHNWGQFIYNESKDIRRTHNSLSPPGPRDQPTAPSGVTTPDYTINPDTPRDSYGALINNDFLDSPFGQFDYDFSGCSGLTNQDEYGECVGDMLQADFQNMASTNILAGFNPIVPMNTHFSKGPDGAVKKWVNNSFLEQFSMASSFRDEETMTPFFTDDDPDEEDIEVQGNISTAMYAIEKKQKSKAKTTNWGIGIPVISRSVSELRGYGNINTQDFFDVNGDGYPDMLYRTESQLTNSLGGLKASQGRNLEGNPDSVISQSESFQKTNTIAFSPSATKTVGRNTSNNDSDSKADTSVSWSGGTSSSTYPDSYDKGLKYWIDINGDGLVDRVETIDGAVRYKLNYGTGLINNPFESFANLQTHESKPVGSTSISIGGGLSGMISATDTFSSGWGVSGSLTGSSSTGSSKVNFQDVNGDGMVDILLLDNEGNTSVRYNMGNKFAPAEGLSKQGAIVNFGNDTKTYNGALTLNGGFYLNVPILWLFGVTILYFRAGADLSASIGVSMSEINKGLRDVNGDGFPDLVTNDGSGLKINYSRIGRTNKLSKVTEKNTNGTFTIDYEFTSPSYNDPHARLVMKEVKILNPHVDSEGYTTSTPDKNSVTRFSYENSRYDRRERTYYGFEKVTAEEMNVNDVYRTSVQTFYNTNYYNNGLLKKNEVYSGTNILKSSSLNTYKLYKYINNYTQLEEIPEAEFDSYDTGGTKGNKIAVILPSGSSNTAYESNGSITTGSVMTYNSKAQLTSFKYNSNVASGSYYSTILYHDVPSLFAKNILNIPSEIKVFNDSNQLVRQRNSELDPNTGDLVKVMAKLNDSQTASTTLTYDSFGNVKTVTDPVSYKLTYDYDPSGKYMIKVTDSFGVFSSSTYDPKWDTVLESTDASGNKMQYSYDNLGRITNILGPKEVGISPYTIKYEYFMTPYSSGSDQIKLYGATTQNFDPEHPSNPIETITLADFTGKTVQVKKDIFVGGTEKMSVSGMALTDLFDRPIKQYHPTFEGKDAVLNKKLKLSLSPYYTITQYDPMDRIIAEADEDGNLTDISYSIEGTAYKKTVSQMQNASTQIKSEAFSNAEGRTVASKNYLSGQPLSTQFTYDAAGQLLTVKDPENIETRYRYDLGGRRTVEEHPDHGATKFTYNLAGQMLTRSTANLEGVSAPIIYQYTQNRLIQIVYPKLQNGAPNPSNVKYTYGTSGNATGRLTKKTDGTGEVTYVYGNMGEVVAERRKIIGVNIPVMNFTTGYEYDSWNRIQKIFYPDGENVVYDYDLGGNLIKVKSTAYGDYIKDIQYDEYEQRTLVFNENETYSEFTYLPTKRLLSSHALKKDNYATYLNNNYEYDFVNNIISNKNITEATPNQLGGGYQMLYGYDSLNRLTHSVGAMLKDIKDDPVDPGNMNASYETSLTYTPSSGISKKKQNHEISGVVNSLNTYENTYKYIRDTHKVESVTNLGTGSIESFTYDKNGNPTRYNNPDGISTMAWDEEDNMKAYYNKDQGVFQYYAYDHAGERTIKYNLKEGAKLYQNGALIDQGAMVLNNYKVYPNPYVVVSSDDTYTKHYYAGSQRIASRLAENTGLFGRSATGTTEQSEEMPDVESDFKSYLDKTGVEAETIETEFARSSAQAGLYYLHGDHLGTATFVTDANAVATQFFVNLPFGETFVEQQVAGT
ncbi:hypothetical protein AOB46_21770, partial [Chryseobacterium indologenes]